MAGNYTLVVNCGESLDTVFCWKIGGVAVDLTGYTAYAYARKTELPEGPFLFSWSTTSAQIAVDSVGHITFNVNAAATNALWYTSSKVDEVNGRARYLGGCWDLVLTSPAGHTKRLLQGKVLLVPSMQ